MTRDLACCTMASGRVSAARGARAAVSVFPFRIPTGGRRPFADLFGPDITTVEEIS